VAAIWWLRFARFAGCLEHRVKVEPHVPAKAQGSVGAAADETEEHAGAHPEQVGGKPMAVNDAGEVVVSKKGGP
jgi:hypothetical protein